MLEGPAAAARYVDVAAAATASVLAGRPAELAVARRALERARSALARGDARAFAAARAEVRTTIVRAAYLEAAAAAARGDAAAARRWLLVREFRPPTRFSRASADATLAVDRLAEGALVAAAAAAAVRVDLLDTYDGRLRSSLEAVRAATLAGFDVRRAEAASGAAGYWRIVRPTYRAQRGPARAARGRRALRAARPRGDGGQRSGSARARRTRARGLPRRAARRRRAAAPRRSAPALRRARPDRVRPGRRGRARRARLRDPGGDHVPGRRCRRVRRPRVGPPPPRRGRDARAQARRLRRSATRSRAATRGDRVAAPETVDATAAEALRLAETVFPKRWREAAETADFDVIAATLDRVQAAAAAGRVGTGRAGAPRGVRRLRARSRAAAARDRAERLPEGRDALLVRRRGGRRARPAPEAQGVRCGARADAARPGRGARGRRGARRRRCGLARLRRREQRDHRLPRGSRGGPDPRRADGEHGRRAARAPTPAPHRRRRRARGERRHVGRRPDGARLARRLGREARGRRLARRDRGAAPDPQLVLPPRLLAGEPPGPAQAEEADPRRRVDRRPLRAGRRARRARVLERLPRGLRDGALPAGDDARGGRLHRPPGRRGRLRRRARGLRARDRARAAPAAQEDARRDRRPDHGRPRRPRRSDGADDAGRRLAAGDARRGPDAPLLGRDVVRRLPDVGGPPRAGGRRGLRRRQLPRRRGAAEAEARADLLGAGVRLQPDTLPRYLPTSQARCASSGSRSFSHASATAFGEPGIETITAPR